MKAKVYFINNKKSFCPCALYHEMGSFTHFYEFCFGDFIHKHKKVKKINKTKLIIK